MEGRKINTNKGKKLHLVTEEQKIRARALRQGGLSYRAIAKELDITSHANIVYWLNDEYRQDQKAKHRIYQGSHREEMIQRSREWRIKIKNENSIRKNKIS